VTELRFFDPFAEIDTHRNFLPHWQQRGATYFITFRLADSIPAHLRAEWEHERTLWRAHHPEPWNAEVEQEFHRRFSGQIDVWLDAAHGACWLRKPEFRSSLAETLRYGDGKGYALQSWVIMPNHAHVLVSLHPDSRIEVEVGAWKSISARAINAKIGRRGTLWQEDYFDRLVRDRAHFGNCARYIRRNPEKARLRTGEYELWQGPLAVEAQGEGAPSPQV
jgi:putative transposase